MADYTLVNLRELDNMALKYGHSENMEARFATKPLKLEKSGLGFQKVLPNKTIPFKHRHAEQEEVFIFVEGGGKLLLDEEVVEVKAWDAVRVPPQVVRQVKAGAEGLEMIIVGAPYTGVNDTEMIKD